MNDISTVEGQAVYTKSTLSIYDFGVLVVSNSLAWKCPTRILEQEFKNNVSDNHVDIGVGTGYYPDRCIDEAKGIKRIAFIDLNNNSLESAKNRNIRFSPETYQCDIMHPLELSIAKFDSASINFLLHCLPGNLTDKEVVFKNISSLVTPGGCIFGSTILGEGVKHNFLGRKLMSIYNKKGIFGNATDGPDELESLLRKNFDEVSFRIEGCVAVFQGRVR